MKIRTSAYVARSYGVRQTCSSGSMAGHRADRGAAVFGLGGTRFAARLQGAESLDVLAYVLMTLAAAGLLFRLVRRCGRSDHDRLRRGLPGAGLPVRPDPDERRRWRCTRSPCTRASNWPPRPQAYALVILRGGTTWNHLVERPGHAAWSLLPGREPARRARAVSEVPAARFARRTGVPLTSERLRLGEEVGRRRRRTAFLSSPCRPEGALLRAAQGSREGLAPWSKPSATRRRRPVRACWSELHLRGSAEDAGTMMGSPTSPALAARMREGRPSKRRVEGRRRRKASHRKPGWLLTESAEESLTNLRHLLPGIDLRPCAPPCAASSSRTVTIRGTAKVRSPRATRHPPGHALMPRSAGPGCSRSTRIGTAAAVIAPRYVAA